MKSPALNEGLKSRGQERARPDSKPRSETDAKREAPRVPHNQWNNINVDTIFKDWKEGSLSQTVNKFREEFGLEIPRKLGAYIDSWKLKAEQLYGSPIRQEEFYALSLCGVMIAAWVYITCIPWRYRVLVGLGLALYSRTILAATAAAATSIPRIWNIVVGERARIEDRHSETWIMAAILAVFAALSGKLEFNITIAVIGTAALFFLVGCAQKAANHSITGARKSVDIGIVLLMLVSAVASAYYYHDITKWYTCGALRGDMQSMCHEKLSEGQFHRTMKWIREYYLDDERGHTMTTSPWMFRNPWTKSQVLVSYVGMAMAMAALTLPSIVSIIGDKYKSAGSGHMAALRRSKSDAVFTTEGMKVNLTLADFSITSDSIPAFATAAIGVAYLMYEPPIGVVMLVISMVAPWIAYWWFKVFLAADFAIEGSKQISAIERVVGEGGISIMGQRKDNHLPYKASMAVVMLLSLCLCLTATNLIGVIGILAGFAPGAMYCLKPEWLGRLALATYAFTTVPTGEVAISAVITAGCLLAVCQYHMRMRSLKSEEVMQPLTTTD